MTDGLSRVEKVHSYPSYPWTPFSPRELQEIQHKVSREYLHNAFQLPRLLSQQ